MPDSATDLVRDAEAVFESVAANPVGQAPAARAAVERARQSGLAEPLVVTLRALALAERWSQRNASALQLLDEAELLAEREGLTSRRGEVLLSRVAVLHEMGQLQAAQVDIDRAQLLLPGEMSSQVTFQQAVLQHNAGELAAAERGYRVVLSAEPDALLRAKATNNLAHLESERGHYEAASELLNDSDALAAAAGPIAGAFLAETRARVSAAGGKLADGLLQFENARRRYEEAGLPLGEHWLETIQALAALRLVPEARAAAARAIEALPEDEVSLMAAEAQLHLAALAALSGEVAVATAAAERGGALARAQGRRGWAALAMVLTVGLRGRADDLHPGDLEALQAAAEELEECGLRADAVEAFLLLGTFGATHGRQERATAALTTAARLALDLPVLVRLRGTLAAARAADLDRDPTTVLDICHLGLADLSSHRLALPSMELRARASDHGRELGELGLRTLRSDTGVDPVLLLSWLERTRSAALAPLEAPPDDSLETELSGLRALHAELAASRAAGVATPSSLPSRIRDAEAAVRRLSWGASSTPSSRDSEELMDVAQVQAKLGSAVLVEYGILDGHVFAVVLEGTRSRTVELGADAGLSAVLDQLQFALRRLSRPGGHARGMAQRSTLAAIEHVRTRFIAPLGLPPGAPVVVVPVGDLQRMPWAPLHDGPVTVTPSAAVWLRTLRPLERPGHVALIGGPDLPGAGTELTALAEIHPGAVLRPDSSCADAVAALHGADLAHLACHGQLRADNPAFSSLLLTDGPLTVHELSRRAGTPARVVLAACESGAQVLLPGDEALGFVSALLARGCTAVIASDVLVPDEPSLPLMVELHRALAEGSTLARALWTARRVLDTDDPLHLATWCAFDAYGGG